MTLTSWGTQSMLEGWELGALIDSQGVRLVSGYRVTRVGSFFYKTESCPEQGRLDFHTHLNPLEILLFQTRI